MRVVIQRVSKALVKAQGEVVGKIGKGLFILVGVFKDDSEQDALYLADKLSKLRVMADDNGKMNLSVSDVKGGILVVSQFTLCADTTAGNRPSFIKAAAPDKALDLYNLFVERLNKLGLVIETGSFGNYMQIEAHLDGPVTVVLDSKDRK